MVIKGRSRSNGKQLAAYLLQNKENDRAEVIDIRGTARPDSLHRSLLEMSLTSELSKRGELGLYHSQINPAIGEDRPMTQADWLKAVDILEQNLKLDGQKRAVVLHEKNGRVHAHIVWQRYDDETGKFRSDSHNFKKHDQARAQIEQELGHERTPQKREKEPTHKERLTELWQQCTDGRSFIEAAEKAGYYIAQKEDKRAFRAITPDGKSIDLVRQLDGFNTKAVRDRLQPIRADLWQEAEALKLSKADRQKAAEPEQEQQKTPADLRDQDASQDLAMAMLDHVRTSKPEPVFSYSFTINQPPNPTPDMLYSDLLAKQQEELRTLNHDYYVAHETIKQMSGEHFDEKAYAGELERLQTAHEQTIKESQTRFEQERREFLNEPEPTPVKEKTGPEIEPDLTGKQEQINAMVAAYKQRQAERRGRVRETSQEPVKDTAAAANQADITDEAAKLVEEYKQRQQERRERGHTGLSLEL